mmetsp:Transcript_21008/g.46198  ORF Transcript_21008/g.46198 Transcript_21008/m.46198 type:complete len:276 (+) Transcript_21008:426-1253(+)
MQPFGFFGPGCTNTTQMQTTVGLLHDATHVGGARTQDGQIGVSPPGFLRLALKLVNGDKDPNDQIFRINGLWLLFLFIPRMANLPLRVCVRAIITSWTCEILVDLIAGSRLETLRCPMEFIHLWCGGCILTPTQPQLSTFDLYTIHFLDRFQRAFRRLELCEAEAPADAIFLDRQAPGNHAFDLSKEIFHLLLSCVKGDVPYEDGPNILPPGWILPPLHGFVRAWWPHQHQRWQVPQARQQARQRRQPRHARGQRSGQAGQSARNPGYPWGQQQR